MFLVWLVAVVFFVFFFLGGGGGVGEHCDLFLINSCQMGG